MPLSYWEGDVGPRGIRWSRSPSVPLLRPPSRHGDVPGTPWWRRHLRLLHVPHHGVVRRRHRDDPRWRAAHRRRGARSRRWRGGTFEAFQEAWNSNSVARSVAVYADAGEDEIETVLYGEAGDDSADRVTRQVELVRTLLVGRGYEEIVVTIGIDVDLAAAGHLGGFHQVPDPDRPGGPPTSCSAAVDRSRRPDVRGPPLHPRLPSRECTRSESPRSLPTRPSNSRKSPMPAPDGAAVPAEHPSGHAEARWPMALAVVVAGCCGPHFPRTPQRRCPLAPPRPPCGPPRCTHHR